ncbi:MAG: hypothetical protein U9Q58_09890 [Pseudomonadota bacterium]|nr:hypothetical protein [Pseudomonadota bacterium]
MVNTIDFIYCLLDMCKSIAGILPSDCADLLISSGLFKGLQSVMASVIEDPGLITQINSDTEKSILSDFAGCICSLSSIHTFETVNEALDFASAFNWVVEDIAWNNFIAYIGRDFDAYDDILLEPKNTVIGSWYWCDDANCSQAYEPGEGRQNMILYGPEKNYKASVDGFGDGTWTMEGGSTVTIVVTNIDDRTYTFEGKAVDGCQRIIDGRYIETSNFPIDIINHCWFAQKYK